MRAREHRNLVLINPKTNLHPPHAILHVPTCQLTLFCALYFLPKRYVYPCKFYTSRTIGNVSNTGWGDTYSDLTPAAAAGIAATMEQVKLKSTAVKCNSVNCMAV